MRCGVFAPMMASPMVTLLPQVRVGWCVMVDGEVVFGRFGTMTGRQTVPRAELAALLDAFRTLDGVGEVTVWCDHENAVNKLR